MTLKIGMQHWVLEYYQVCSNDDDLDLFNGKVKFGSLCFLDGKKVKQWIFSETIVVFDIKVGRCSQLDVYMKLMSNNGPDHSLTLIQISQIQYF